MFSLQNGCAYPLGLCKMGVRAPMVSIFMFMFFSFSRKAVVALMVMMLSYVPMICKCVYTLRCPAFGLKSLQDGCALRMCCFCIVIQYCSSKIIKYWWGSSKHMIFKKKWFSLQNGFAWGTSYPEKVAIIPSSIILWNFHVLFSPPQSFPILSNFEAKICTQCACMVYVLFLHCYFILFHQNHRK